MWQKWKRLKPLNKKTPVTILIVWPRAFCTVNAHQKQVHWLIRSVSRLQLLVCYQSKRMMLIVIYTLGVPCGCTCYVQATESRCHCSGSLLQHRAVSVRQRGFLVLNGNITRGRKGRKGRVWLLMGLRLTAIEGVSCRMGLPSIRQKWTRIALTPVRHACTRFTYPGGMEGWVELCDWLHTKMVFTRP